MSKSKFVKKNIRSILTTCLGIMFLTGGSIAYVNNKEEEHQKLFRRAESKADVKELYGWTTRDEWKIVYQKLGLEFKFNSDPYDLTNSQLRKYLEIK